MRKKLAHRAHGMSPLTPSRKVAFLVPRWCLQGASGQSIPQLSKEVQALAIRTLPIFVSLSSIFVIVAPKAVHTDTGALCDFETVAAPSSSPSTATGASKISTRRRRKTAR